MAKKRIRPDFSDVVAHFTADRPPYGIDGEKEERKAALGGNALGRLAHILQEKTIWATKMPHTDQPAVCFTECTWASLLDHAEEYSPCGIGFTKDFLFGKGGGPAVYIRADLFKKQLENKGFHPDLYPFLTPFRPQYAPKQHKEDYWNKKEAIDYTHEREWRVTSDLGFEYTDVSFVVVKTVEDIDKLPKDAVTAIGMTKFIAMDVYRKVEELWPTHLMP
jgi:hypothetical protein